MPRIAAKDVRFGHAAVARKACGFRFGLRLRRRDWSANDNVPHNLRTAVARIDAANATASPWPATRAHSHRCRQLTERPASTCALHRGGRRRRPARRHAGFSRCRDVRFPTIQQLGSGHQWMNSTPSREQTMFIKPQGAAHQPPLKKSRPLRSSLRKYPRATLPYPTVLPLLHWPAAMSIVTLSVRARSTQHSGHGR
jgi:hypothetical protein